MVKSLNEKLDDAFMSRAENLVESKEEKTSESIKAEFAELEKIHKKYFPDSESWFQSSALGLPAIFFGSTVTPEKSWQYGYSDNDPMKSMFSISYKSDGKFVVELIRGAQLLVMPGPGSVYAREGIKVPFRKYTGTVKQIIAKIEAWEKKRKETFEEYKDRLPK